MRKTILNFDHNRRALWEKATLVLRTPVRERSPVSFIGKGPLPWLQAGLPALSRYTMLADDGHPVVAMSASEYTKALIEEQIQEVPFPDENAVTIARWRYRPGILSDGPTVDRLSLYLSLRDEKDERIQSALKQLLEGVKW